MTRSLTRLRIAPPCAGLIPGVAPRMGGGGNRYWYEKFEDRAVADAKGVLPCRACHLTGRDYVLTPWPLQ